MAASMDHEATITGLAHGGAGVARLDGKVVFVPRTLPGETVQFEPLIAKRTYAWGRLTRVIQPSPLRRDPPPCDLFGECGGCHWQHIQDSLQAGFKETVFRDLVSRNTAVLPERILPIVPSPRMWNYRASITLKVDGGDVGFYAARSHRVVPIPKCLLASPILNEVLGILQEPDLRVLLRTYVQELQAASPDGIHASLCLRTKRPLSLPEERRIAERLRRVPGVACAAWTHGRGFHLRPFGSRREGPWGAPLPPPWPGLPQTGFWSVPGVFLQANREQNIRMIREVLSLLDGIGKGLKILELFSGAGNFTLPMALAGHRVDAFEIHPAAVDNARWNLQQTTLDTVSIHTLSAEQALMRSRKRHARCDVLVMDPPRTGIKKEAAIIAECNAPHLIYISCEPAAWRRDENRLRRGGYECLSSLPLDLFPQTYHVESIHHLAR